MSTTPLLSVVIPTHNRAEILQKTLEHLEQQTVKDQIEVIVVSDVRGKGKREKGNSNMNVQYFEVPPCHQGVARNFGVTKVTAPITLFIGDDIFLAPDACEKHLAPFPFPLSPFPLTATLGFTTWDPTLEITPVMKWLEESGWQFGYPMIQQFAHLPIRPSIQHRFTYTSHLSLPTEVALRFPFREDVTLYGWEDIEWGWRLKQAGVQLFYEPDAKAFHHHHLTLEKSLKRMETLGESAIVMDRINPELKIVPRGWKLLKYQLASLLPNLRGQHAKAFLQGIQKSTLSA